MKGGISNKHGWKIASLGDIGLVRLGKTPRKSDYRDSGEYKILKFRDISDGNIDWENSKKGFVVDLPEALVGLREICVGDALVTASAHMSEHIGKKAALVRFIPNRFKSSFVVGEILQIRLDAGIDPRWVVNFISSKNGYDSIQKKVQGVHLMASRARDIEIPVAPSDEQRRVADKIDELFPDLDAGTAALQRARANLMRYRAAVLKAAVEGKLTEQWRKAHPDVEPASKLLERILAERRKKWEEAQLAKFAAAGKAPPKAWKDKYPEPGKPNTADLTELPKGWCWAHIEQLCDFGPHALKAGPFGSSVKKSMYVPSGYKIYGQEQVIRGDPYYGDYYVDANKFDELKSCAIKPGDLLISLVGTIGRTLVLPEDSEPGIINPRLIKVSLNREIVVPGFMQSYLKSPQVRAIFELVSHGGTMEILNMGTLTSLAYPLPPKEEQRTIVNEIAAADSVVDHVSALLEGQLDTASRLRQSILKRAFEGELVQQDPLDEPASVLLERIRAARAGEARSNGKRKKVKVTPS